VTIVPPPAMAFMPPARKAPAMRMAVSRVGDKIGYDP